MLECWKARTVDAMRATAWHNGGAPDQAAGYGIKFTKGDRDRHFDPAWTEIIIKLDSDQTTVALSPSFWRNCSELRSVDIGRWLLEAGAAPWASGNPPGIAVNRLDDNRFTARLLKKHNLL